ncbi:hypothetical protein [Xanthomonas sp. 3498]|uniref:hypothetical protein n=1 Tax=Xanthomonas sp. 3498 TaxID=2663863 RepID=UPI001612B686|nr:hypothetical protein [Xanthomonas sp. 3498]MBB5875871.1 hypothetical protein [Xanthomonas sp. 3498]
MKERPFGRDTVVLLIMAFGFGALFAWGLVTPPSGKVHVAAGKPIDWPAWVQAVGSVLAICAAVLIARWQRISELLDTRDREARAALSLGAVLLTDIKRLRSNLQEAVWSVEYQHPDCGTVSSRLVPEQLWRNVAELHRLGEPGSQLLRAVFRYQEAMDVAEIGILLPEEYPQYLEHMRAALAHCDSALEGIRGMRD